jgi:hypothetical protein
MAAERQIGHLARDLRDRRAAERALGAGRLAVVEAIRESPTGERIFSMAS